MRRGAGDTYGQIGYLTNRVADLTLKLEKEKKLSLRLEQEVLDERAEKNQYFLQLEKAKVFLTDEQLQVLNLDN